MLQTKSLKENKLSSIFQKEYDLTKMDMKKYYLKLLLAIKNNKSTKRIIKKTLLLSRHEVIVFQFHKTLEVFYDDYRPISEKINPENVNFENYSLETCIYIIKSLEDFVKDIFYNQCP